MAAVLGFTPNWVTPVVDLTLSERQAVKDRLRDGLWANAEKLSIRTDPDQVVIRDILPSTDFGVTIGGPAVGAGTANDWVVQGVGVYGTLLAALNAIAIPVDRVVGVCGIDIESVPWPISAVRFLNLARVLAYINVETLANCLEPRGVFSQNMFWLRNDTLTWQVMPRWAFPALTARVKLEGYILEPTGVIVTAPVV